MRKSPKSILCDRTGASMLLVMAVMALLIAVGGSALAAASTAVGQVASKREAQQLTLYTESINQTFLYSLQADDPDTKLLGKQLIHALYQNKLLGDRAPLPTGFAVEVTGYTLPPDVSAKMTVYFTPDVGITPYSKAINTVELDPDGNPTGGQIELIPRQPQSALVDATMEVVTVVEGKGIRVTSAATYRLSGAYLEDNGQTATIMDFTKDPYDGNSPNDASRGRWEMIAYEKLDSRY